MTCLTFFFLNLCQTLFVIGISGEISKGKSVFCIVISWERKVAESSNLLKLSPHSSDLSNIVRDNHAKIFPT